MMYKWITAGFFFVGLLLLAVSAIAVMIWTTLTHPAPHTIVPDVFAWILIVGVISLVLGFLMGLAAILKQLIGEGYFLG